MSIFLTKKKFAEASNFVKTYHFSIFRLFCRPFSFTIATLKVNYIPDVYTLVIALIHKSQEIGEKKLSLFGSRGDQISPLMPVELLIGLNKA